MDTDFGLPSVELERYVGGDILTDPDCVIDAVIKPVVESGPCADLLLLRPRNTFLVEGGHTRMAASTHTLHLTRASLYNPIFPSPSCEASESMIINVSASNTSHCKLL